MCCLDTVSLNCFNKRAKKNNRNRKNEKRKDDHSKFVCLLFLHRFGLRSFLPLLIFCASVISRACVQSIYDHQPSHNTFFEYICQTNENRTEQIAGFAFIIVSMIFNLSYFIEIWIISTKCSFCFVYFFFPWFVFRRMNCICFLICSQHNLLIAFFRPKTSQILEYLSETFTCFYHVFSLPFIKFICLK